MWRKFLRAKIHAARVTAKNLDYEGSLTLDPALLSAAGIAPFESIWVYNLNNGERFETYVIRGEAGSGEVCLNGAAARKGEVGDRLILVTYAWLSPEELKQAEATVVLVNERNEVVRRDRHPILG